MIRNRDLIRRGRVGAVLCALAGGLCVIGCFWGNDFIKTNFVPVLEAAVQAERRSADALQREGLSAASAAHRAADAQERANDAFLVAMEWAFRVAFITGLLLFYTAALLWKARELACAVDGIRDQR